ncbi:MAG: S9 family peptidase, partial [Chthoniobacterales bacterium]
MKRFTVAAVFVLLGTVFTFAKEPTKPFDYPIPPKSEQSDDYHGTKVADPYRPLENADSPETKKWIEEENKLTFKFLEGVPERKKINDRLTKLWNYEKYGVPYREGERFFFTKNTGLQNQSVLYTAPKLPGEPKLLLDPNTLAKDGTTALTGSEVSHDGKLLAYGLAQAGSDWQEWKVREIESGKDREDTIKWVKFSNASWDRDGSGFFYSRYDEPTADQLKAANYFHKLYFHRLGTPQTDDKLVYERPDRKGWLFNGSVTEDGSYLIITVSEGTESKNRVFFKALAGDEKPVVELLNKQDAEYVFIGNDGPVFWFRTTLEAPRGRIIAIDTTKPEDVKELVAQTEDKLAGVQVVGDRFIANYLKDAHSLLRLFELSGKPDGEIALPGIGTASGFSGKRGDTETFYTYVSYTEPPTVFRYDLKSA